LPRLIVRLDELHSQIAALGVEGERLLASVSPHERHD